MSALFEIIWSGEVFGQLGMILIFAYVGRTMVKLDRESIKLSSQLAAIAFFVFSLVGIVLSLPTSSSMWFVTFFSALLSALLVMTAGWVFLPPARSIYKQFFSNGEEIPDDNKKIPQDWHNRIAPALSLLTDRIRPLLNWLGLELKQIDPESGGPTTTLDSSQNHKHPLQQEEDKDSRHLKLQQQCDDVYRQYANQVQPKLHQDTFQRLKAKYLCSVKDANVAAKRADLIISLIISSAKNRNHQGIFLADNFNSEKDLLRAFTAETDAIHMAPWDQVDKLPLLEAVQVDREVALAQWRNNR